MDLNDGTGKQARFEKYKASLAAVLGHCRPFEALPREAPLPPRPGTRLCRDEVHQPVSAKTLVLELAADAWQQIKWRDGSNTPLTSRFARWRVRPAHDDAGRSEPAAEEWLLIESNDPEGAAEPDHYWLATQPADISLGGGCR